MPQLDDELTEYDLLGLAALISDRAISAGELLEVVQRRIDLANPVLNAVVATFKDDEERPTGGPFAGVPFLIKDLYAHVRGQPTTGGCVALRNNFIDHDSEIVARYRAAGLRIVGRTNTCEFGTLGTTEPKMYGATRNPWALNRSPGGSSGGAGAVVAARILPAAHGGDGAGSIRIPASCCGVFGLKPTRGRNSFSPDLGEGLSGIVCEHALSISVRDSAALLDATAGRALGDPYTAEPVEGTFLQSAVQPPGRLRIGLSIETLIGTQTEEECVAATYAAASICEDLGHDVFEILPQIDMDQFRLRYRRLWSLAGTRGIYSAARATGVAPDRIAELAEPFNQYLFDQGTKISAAQYLEDHAWFHKMSRDLCRQTANCDAWLTPTLGTVPPTLGTFDAGVVGGDEVMERFFTFLGYTMFANLTGQPSMSVPLHWSGSNLPIGVQFTAGAGKEQLLFSLAAQLENASPWGSRRPWPAT